MALESSICIQFLCHSLPKLSRDFATCLGFVIADFVRIKYS